MVSNELLQASIITKLKANASLTTWLAARSSSNEIREGQYQGAAFAYPAVRVQVGTQTPESELSKCYTTNGEFTFSVIAFSEGDSSKECDVLAGLIDAALTDKVLTGSGFRTLRILKDGLPKATRTGERLWQSTGLYRAYVFQTS